MRVCVRLSVCGRASLHVRECRQMDIQWFGVWTRKDCGVITITIIVIIMEQNVSDGLERSVLMPSIDLYRRIDIYIFI